MSGGPPSPTPEAAKPEATTPTEIADEFRSALENTPYVVAIGQWDNQNIQRSRFRANGYIREWLLSANDTPELVGLAAQMAEATANGYNVSFANTGDLQAKHQIPDLVWLKIIFNPNKCGHQSERGQDFLGGYNSDAISLPDTKVALGKGISCPKIHDANGLFYGEDGSLKFTHTPDHNDTEYTDTSVKRTREQTPKENKINTTDNRATTLFFSSDQVSNSWKNVLTSIEEMGAARYQFLSEPESDQKNRQTKPTETSSNNLSPRSENRPVATSGPFETGSSAAITAFRKSIQKLYDQTPIGWRVRWIISALSNDAASSSTIAETVQLPVEYVKTVLKILTRLDFIQRESQIEKGSQSTNIESSESKYTLSPSVQGNPSEELNSVLSPVTAYHHPIS